MSDQHFECEQDFKIVNTAGVVGGTTRVTMQPKNKDANTWGKSWLWVSFDVPYGAIPDRDDTVGRAVTITITLEEQQNHE